MNVMRVQFFTYESVEEGDVRACFESVEDKAHLRYVGRISLNSLAAVPTLDIVRLEHILGSHKGNVI